MNKTFYSYSFGCRVNQAEKEALDRQLVSMGYSFEEKDPGIYIINTCSVTNKAEREAKQLIYQVRKSLPETKIVVTGCAATNWIKTKTEIKEVDMLIDNQSKEYIASIIEKRLENKNSAENQGLTAPVKLNLINDKFLKSRRAIIRIQDGCQRFCSYCIVPYLRGLPKSVPIQTVVDTINGFDNKMQEVILAAINTEAFGYDSKETFIDLIRRVMKETEVRRLSFGSVHPWTVTDEFLEMYGEFAQSKRFVHFFHIPLQSGSNKMLNLMKRGYTREEFLEKLHKLQSLNEFAFIGTDVIVGFLEETDADFADTYSFLEQTPVNKFHVFRFSKRQHTAAFHLAKRLNEPDPQTKQKRAKALADLGKKKYAAFLEKHVGNRFEALFLEKREGEMQHVLLENQIPAVVRSEKDMTGEIREVEINEYKNEKLFGTMD